MASILVAAGCGGDSGDSGGGIGGEGGPTNSCMFLTDFCDTCDLQSNKEACEASATSGNETKCQQDFENVFSPHCYPTSEYCEELRLICDTCTDATQEINCITASSSTYAYDDPALCMNFDIGAQGSCTQP
jgi:hypothetical protein